MASDQQHHYVFIPHWHFNMLNRNTSNFHFLQSQSLFLLLWFIVIIIFFPTLFLCIYFCRRRLSRQQQPTTTTTIVIPDPHLPDHQSVRVEYFLSSSTTKNKSFEKECCICLSVFQDNEKLKVLTECQHAYHSECLDMWLSAHPNCPLCRASLHVSNSLKK